MRRYIYIIRYQLMLALWLLAACTADEPLQQNEGEPAAVAFSVSTSSTTSATRADNSIDDNAGLALQNGFGVFGCYTGLYKYVDSNVHPDFMYNEHVTSDDAGATWTYTPLKYWPNGEGEVAGNTGSMPHYVSFFAYAPYSDLDVSNPSTNPAGYCIPSFSNQGDLGNPWLTYRLHTDVDKQVDLLYASHTTTGVNPHPLLDLTKPSTNEKVHFVFSHALACVGEEMTFACSDNMKAALNARSGYTKVEVLVTECKIDYTLTEKGRLVLWNTDGEANWQTILSGNPTCNRTVTVIRKKAGDSDTDPKAVPQVIYSYIKGDPGTVVTDMWAPAERYGVFYIPIEVSPYVQTAKVSLTYVVRYYTDYEYTAYTQESEVTGTAGLTLHDYTTPPNDGYKPGKYLNLNVLVDMVALRISASILNWQVEPEKEKEGIEVDE